MTTDNSSEPARTRSDSDWITQLARISIGTQLSAESRMRTMINCDIRANKPSIYVPPEMTQLQPRSQRYLHVFARTHNLHLVEDRRRVSTAPLNEQRRGSLPLFGTALSHLFAQLGMPGKTRPASWPHRLGPGSQHVEISQLVRMAAFATPRARHVTVCPNEGLNTLLSGKTPEIHAHGCKLVSEEISTLLTVFQSRGFQALSYTTGKQQVVQVCLAGGLLSSPELWADFETLTRTDFQFQLFEAPRQADDVGLFHATFYIDLSDTPSPWWLSTRANQRMGAKHFIEPYLLQHAS